MGLSSTSKEFCIPRNKGCTGIMIWIPEKSSPVPARKKAGPELEFCLKLREKREFESS